MRKFANVQMEKLVDDNLHLISKKNYVPPIFDNWFFQHGGCVVQKTLLDIATVPINSTSPHDMETYRFYLVYMQISTCHVI